MLKNFCDDFVLFGRILPVIMAMLPVIIYGIFEGYITNKKVAIPLYGGIFALILIGMEKVVRIWGKNVEIKMYEKLGAKPTTIVLRYSFANFPQVFSGVSKFPGHPPLTA